MWFYNAASKTCRRFWYGGCGGNENRFADKDSCERKCVKRDPETQPPAPTCDTSRFGCCEDRTTFARGPDREGCPEKNRVLPGCARSTYGCCADRKTAARGPGRLGCPERRLVGGCRGTRYGCCPDGFTSARGERYLGCPENPNGGCSNSVYGCCEDQRTFARGPNGKGCPENQIVSCQKSTYGCCPDQVTKAQGENLEGCAEFDPAWCGMPKDPGNCTKYSREWYFNREYGICREFYYGGCFGNANRYPSRAMCEAKCVHLEGSDVCRLPLVTGPCKAKVTRFHFNPATDACEQFTYSNCNGNKNNFETLAECQRTCMDSSGPDTVVLGTAPPTRPPIKPSADLSGPNYVTLRGQMALKCTATSASQVDFDWFKDGNELSAGDPRYTMDVRSIGGYNTEATLMIRSVEMEDSGTYVCRTSDNVLDSQRVRVMRSRRLACESRPCQNGFDCQDFQNGSYSCSCNPDWGQNCERPPNYWCFEDNECEQGSKCVREKECMDNICHVYARCKDASMRYRCDRRLCPNDKDCVNDNTLVEGYFCANKADYRRPGLIRSCRDSRYGCCPGGRIEASGPNFEGCGLVCEESRYGCCPDGRTNARGPNEEGCGSGEVDVGSGEGELPCDDTRYGCCDDGLTPAKGPNFMGCEDDIDDVRTEPPTTTTTTTTTTQRSRLTKSCTSPSVRRKCLAYVVMWRYNADTMSCGRFWWGGCPEDRNAFKTERECLATCQSKTDEDGDGDDFESICDMEKEVGPCRGSMLRYYYNKMEGRCDQFRYGGCRGNENNFRTLGDCQEECMGGRVTTVVVPTTQTPVPNTVPPPSTVTITISGNNRVTVGSQLMLTCTASGYTTPGVLNWIFNGDELQDSANVMIEEEQSVVANGKSVRRTMLKIARARMSDSGVYVCRASDNQIQSRRVVVTDEGKNQLSMGGDTIVEEGMSLQITCTSIGPKQVTFDWFFDRKPFRSSARRRISGKSAVSPSGYEMVSEVQIGSASTSDAGRYHCRTSDGQLRMMAVNVRPTATGTDRPIRPTRPTRPTREPELTLTGQSVVQEGDTIELECMVMGSTNVELDWYFDGDPIAEAKGRAQLSGKSNASPSGYATVSMLRLTNANADDAGVYYCRISGGRLTRKIVVKVNEVAETGRPVRPVRPTRPTIRVTTPAPVDTDSRITMNGSAAVAVGDTLSLRCRGVGPRRPTRIEWYVNTKVVRGNTDRRTISSMLDPNARNALISTFEISEATRNDTAYYYCRQFPTGEYKVMSVRVTDGTEPVRPTRPTRTRPTRPRPTRPRPTRPTRTRPTRPPTVRPTTDSSEEEVSNDPSVVCLMDKEPGPCYAALPRFYYDYKKGQCTQFLYGGCSANSNNFESEEECNNFCSAEAVCQQPKAIGRCRAAIPRFYFDAEAKECRSFIYGGCNGNTNNFQSQASCERKCSPYLEKTTDETDETDEETTQSDVCQLRADKGPCEGYNILWYYSPQRNRCARFIYSGCDGNGNRFDTEEACSSECVRDVATTQRPYTRRPYTRRPYTRQPYTRRPVIRVTTTTSRPAVVTGEADCSAPRDRGTCSEWKIKWYFNTESRRCQRFYYGSCGGNTNRFETQAECQAACNVQTTTQRPVTRRPPRVRDCRRTVYGCCSDGRTVALDSLKSNCRDTNVIPNPGGDETRQVMARLGTDVVLRCSLGSEGITWYKDRDSLIANGNGAFHMHDNGTLVIRSITSRYAGSYSCKSFNGGNNIPQVERFNVEINVPIRIMHGPAMTTAAPGDDVVMTCKATGNPTPRISWHKNGRVLSSSDRYTVYGNGTLFIENAREEDAGNYDCVAENGVGATRKRRIQFVFRESFEVKIQRHKGKYWEGEAITLRCNVNGYGAPTPEWMKDGEVFTSGNRFIVSDGELTIRSATIEDAGSYTCSADNGRETSKDITFVHIRTHTSDTKCQDTLGKYKCMRIVKSRLCYVNPFRRSCCQTCRRNGYTS